MGCRAYILGAGFSQAFGIVSTKRLLDEILRFKHPRWTTITTMVWQEKIRLYLNNNYLGYNPHSQSTDIVQLMNHIDRGDELRTIIEDLEKRSIKAYNEFWTTLTRLMSTYFLVTTIGLMYPPHFPEMSPLNVFLDKLRTNDIIITLNWDTLLEHAFICLRGLNKPFVIGKRSESDISIYKLHGSIDFVGEPNEWMNKYWKEFEPMEIGQDQPMWRVKTYDRKRGWKPEMPWELIGREPLLLAPPADTRHLRNPFMKQMWKNAIEHITECEEFIVVGYSLPRDDYFIQMMLSSVYTFFHKQKSTKIQVIDPDPSGEVERRWRLFLGDAVKMVKQSFEQSPYCKQTDI